MNCNKCDFSNIYVCKECTIERKSRFCPKCNIKIIHQSFSAKKIADKKNSICKKCCSNQIPEKLTNEQINFLDGLMLGDASIVYPSKNRSLYPRLTLRRQSLDKDYMYWQYNLFKDFYNSEPKYMEIFDKRTSKYYNAFSLLSKTGKIFKDYHNIWYPNGKKIIPQDLQLTPLSLLIWFLDDGCVVNTSKNGLTIKFSTEGFSKEEVIMLSSIIKNFSEAELNVYKNGNGFILKGSTLEAIKIIKIIDPIFPECMQRKRTWTKFDFNFVKNSKSFGN